jgi:hypothetical protein
MASDIILDWNSVLLQANANDYVPASGPEQGGPVLDTRAFAIVSAAMYDAYNSIEHIGSKYLTIAPNAQNANVDAAVAQAAHDTLVSLFPRQTAFFNRKLQQTLNQVPDGQQETRGRAVGAFVADKILEARANDHADKIDDPVYEYNGKPGFHDVDPTHPTQGYYGAHGGDITPFAIHSVDDFKARALDNSTPAGRAASLKSQEYLDAYNQVKALGGDGVHTPTTRTAEQTQIGIFWGYDGRPGLGTPVRFFNQIARKVAADQGNTEAENARLFALTNIAMADAGEAAWSTKYDEDFWRPVLAIREGGSDGNQQTVGDANWHALGAQASNPRPGETNFTPPFPAYTSGHATFGGAFFQTLARFYGRDDIHFSIVSDELNGKTKDAQGHVRPVVERSFDSFTQAKLENAQSRIYLGVHWQFDADEGVKQGNAIGNYVYDHILKPTGRNKALLVSHLGGQASYRENAAPTVLFATASVTDSDSSNFAGGKLTIKTTSGSEAADRLAIRSAGGVTTSGSQVKFNGIVIGSYTGGTGQQPLVVTLNANATPFRVQAVLHNITYRSLSENPSTTIHHLYVGLADGDGGTSNGATKTLKVAAVNDAPAIALGGGIGYHRNAPAVLLAGTATVKDPDSANFAGGLLRVQTTNGASGDRLTIGGNFKVLGERLLWNGTTIGSIQAGGGVGNKALVIHFNTNANRFRVEQLVRSIKFGTVGIVPLSQRSVTFALDDGHDLSHVATKTVNVST